MNPIEHSITYNKFSISLQRMHILLELFCYWYVGWDSPKFASVQIWLSHNRWHLGHCPLLQLQYCPLYVFEEGLSQSSLEGAAL